MRPVRGLRLIVTIAVAGLLVTGCGPKKVVAASSGPGSTSAAGTGTPGSSPTSTVACDLTIGAQLRERVTVASNGAVSLAPGPLPCRGVGIWAGRFALDQDVSADPSSTFVSSYTGARAVTVPVPPVSDPCAASAVYFAVDGVTADAATAQHTASEWARTDLHGWPAGLTTTVPGGAILQGHPSVVLAGSVVGDPGACTSGEHVSTPLAAVGDCWLAATVAPGGTSGAPAAPSGQGTPASGQGTPAAGTAGPDDRRTRFSKVSCNAPHTHEIYWVQPLDPVRYTADTATTKQPAATWARDLGSKICGERSTTLSLTHDVDRDDIALEFQWPSTLTAPSATRSWSRAQVVCLARWKTGKASDRHLLHR